MENVAVTTLEIKGTEKVATSMKELKQQITDYRNELVALGQIENKNEQQMEEQTRVIEKLRKATKLLSDVTNAHKNTEGQLNKAIDMNTASYNELQAELTKLKKAYKDMSAAERDSEFGQETLKTISELDVKLKDLDAGMGQYQRNVGNYGRTFEESMTIARQSSGYLSQGIGTLNGILALSGNENEGLQKGLIATTLALQVMQNEGVSKLIIKLKEMIAAKKTAIATTSLLKKALAGLGIGAVVAGVVALVTNWDKLRSLIKGSTNDFEKSAKAIKKEEAAMKSNIETMKAKGATNEVVLKAEIEYLSEISQKYNDLAISLMKRETIRDEYRKAAEKASEKQEEFNEKLQEGERLLYGVVAAGAKAWDQRFMSDYEKKLDDINRQYKEMQDLRKSIFMEGGLSEGTEFTDLGNEIDTWYQQQLDLLIEARNKEMDARLAAARQQEQKEAEERRKAKEKQLADEEAYELAAIKAEEEYGERMAEQLSWELEQELAAKKAAAEEEKQILLDTIHAREEADKREAELAAARKQMYIDSARDTASATSSILGSIADTIEALAEDENEAAKKTKALRITSTTIDTISGATGAYMQAASTIPPPTGIIVGATQAAAVLATGMANIAKMKATSLSSLSSPSFSSPSASVSAPNVPTQLDAVRNLTSASEEERLNRMAQSQKVYILQSDIEAAGAASKVQVTESTF